MGFFTLEIARLVGPNGRVIAVDLQSRMLESLRRRARRAGLEDRIETRLARPNHMSLEDLRASVDFVFAMAMLHEVEETASFLAELFMALKQGGRLLVSEPKHHVSQADFAQTLAAAEEAGFRRESNPAIRGSMSALFVKPKGIRDR